MTSWRCTQCSKNDKLLPNHQAHDRKKNMVPSKEYGKYVARHIYEIPTFASIFHISSHRNVVAQLVSQAKEGSSLYLRAFLVLLKVHFSPQLAAAI